MGDPLRCKRRGQGVTAWQALRTLPHAQCGGPDQERPHLVIDRALHALPQRVQHLFQRVGRAPRRP